jgi:hypothetical protein
MLIDAAREENKRKRKCVCIKNKRVLKNSLILSSETEPKPEDTFNPLKTKLV